MNIRYLQSTDADQIYNIYHNFFSDMEFPDFYGNFHAVFVVENESNNGSHNRIIAIGGLKPIAEAVVLTNQDFSVRDRMEALLHILNGVTYAAEKTKYNQIHAFAWEPEYIRHLTERMGFKCLKENRVLTLDINHGQKERT